MAEVTAEELQKRFDRITEIFSGIVTQADEQSCRRCPYRDRHDLCTAKFRCGNQADPIENPTDNPDALRCTHNGVFDFRSAWESDPRATRKVRERLHEQRQRPSSTDPSGQQ